MVTPSYHVDPFWAKPLPHHWLVGAIAGVAVDAKDHVWITHRPSTLQPNELRSIWKAAPPVLEFDQDGTLVQAWGGPGAGYEWPQLEHGIYVDARDQVWLGGGGDKDTQILKFTRDGRFLLQIGHQGQGRGSNDTANLGAAANMVVDEAAREVYVADGYVNHRVIVFDADSGAYKRLYVLKRATLELVDTFGGAGRWAGQFYGAHNLAVDSTGNLFIGETYEGKRLQKFMYQDARPKATDPIRTGDYTERGLTA